MIKQRKENKDKKHIRINNIVTLLTVGVLCFISVGYALYTQIISLDGNVSVKTQGDFYISGVRLITSSNVDTNYQPTYTDNYVDFNLAFKDSGEDSYSAVYEIDVNNDTFYDQTFNGFEYSPIIRDSNGDEVDSSLLSYTVSGIDDYVFPKLDTKTITVNIIFTPTTDGDYTTDGDGVIDATEKPEGNLRGSVTSATGDLTGTNELAQFTINVMNTYVTNREFTLSLGNPNFEVCDSTGNPTSFNIAPNTEQNYTFYVKKKDGAKFSESSYNVSVILKSVNLPTNNTGNITLLVDEDQEYQDQDPPVISDVSVTLLNQNGSVDVSFNGSDESDITEYYIVAYRNNTVVSTVNVDGNTNSYSYTGLNAGNYYFVVYGIDENGNSGESYVSSATTDSGFASRSDTTDCRWTYNVTYNLTNLTANNGTVNRGQTYTGTINREGNYNLPNNLTSVTMGGVALNNNQYTYTRNNNNRATITIPNVTGDVVIRASGTRGGCLVEGTKILLANGKSKKIEDIEYNDLLKVYNHVTGKVTYVYPIWLEKRSVIDSYTKVTLEDGTVIKFTRDHSIYNADTNMYASILDPNQIDKGSSVYKLVNDKLVKVKIKKIETINKKVGYYNIVSAIHYNVFSNDILTSDSTASISNIYGFDDDTTYSDNYDKINDGEELPYEKVDYMPKYLYYGLNLKNASFIFDYDINLYDVFKNYIDNDKIMKSYEKKNKKLLFYVNVDNKAKKVSEGTNYKLPNNKNIKYYLETSTNKKYRPGDKVRINYSMYFKGIKN